MQGVADQATSGSSSLREADAKSSAASNFFEIVHQVRSWSGWAPLWSRSKTPLLIVFGVVLLPLILVTLASAFVPMDQPVWNTLATYIVLTSPLVFIIAFVRSRYSTGKPLWVEYMKWLAYLWLIAIFVVVALVGFLRSILYPR